MPTHIFMLLNLFYKHYTLLCISIEILNFLCMRHADMLSSSNILLFLFSQTVQHTACVLIIPRGKEGRPRNPDHLKKWGCLY